MSLVRLGFKLKGAAGSVVPGTQTYDAGSGNHVVQPYNTLVVEEWGAGGGSGAVSTASSPASHTDAGNGGSSTVTVGSDSLVADGGAGSVSLWGPGGGSTSPGAAGSASGGDTNTTGTQGDAGLRNVGVFSGNHRGGSSPNGGAYTASQTEPASPGTIAGADGNAPGGGAQPPGANSGGGATYMPAGGSGGGYCKKTYTYGVGQAPAWGALLPYSVGVGGAAGTIEVIPTSKNGAVGAAGRVKFTWS